MEMFSSPYGEKVLEPEGVKYGEKKEKEFSSP